MPHATDADGRVVCIAASPGMLGPLLNVGAVEYFGCGEPALNDDSGSLYDALRPSDAVDDALMLPFLALHSCVAAIVGVRPSSS